MSVGYTSGQALVFGKNLVEIKEFTLHILSVNGRKKNCTYKMITQQKNIGTLN
jgi:hypothetical protein